MHLRNLSCAFFQNANFCSMITTMDVIGVERIEEGALATTAASNMIFLSLRSVPGVIFFFAACVDNIE